MKLPWEVQYAVKSVLYGAIDHSFTTSDSLSVYDIDTKLQTLNTLGVSAMVITETQSRGLYASEPPYSLSTYLLPYVICVRSANEKAIRSW